MKTKKTFRQVLKPTSLSDKQVYSILYIDNKDMRLESSYDVKDKSKLNVRFEMTGFPLDIEIHFILIMSQYVM